MRFELEIGPIPEEVIDMRLKLQETSLHLRWHAEKQMVPGADHLRLRSDQLARVSMGHTHVMKAAETLIIDGATQEGFEILKGAVTRAKRLEQFLAERDRWW
ncbi:hypothetical protein XhyaCFBP1156_21130 [Xanthomonas hyacinthi]|uniref:Uncharacterized protein n=1 Tax=Xanthomonas hyacinthi TaxID=56455 RepID=A0A2S7EMV8_9XANT|nr:hypothetical protein Y886_35575 [Xanthomonas hyacinthi DSM 19077]PPU92132.1 hypothetical protein XhyaCFBP1156_21130 [Xanthomonas hyacinthi]